MLTTSPLSMCKSIPFSTCRLPKLFVIPLISIIMSVSFLMSEFLQPSQNQFIGAVLLRMLRLGKCHFVHHVAVLVGEYDENTFAREVLSYLFGQLLEGVLVRNGAFTGRHDHEKMVLGDGRCQSGQLIPMLH